MFGLNLRWQPLQRLHPLPVAAPTIGAFDSLYVGLRRPKRAGLKTASSTSQLARLIQKARPFRVGPQNLISELAKSAETTTVFAKVA